VPSYDELVLVVRESELNSRTDVIRRFVQALGRGYESVRSDPTSAVNNLTSANPSLSPKLQLASVKTTLPAYFPSGPDAGQPWGWQDQAQWDAYGQWMLKNHLISSPAAYTDASTNELLAGQGS
jgi:ABC-type nitrate/sulfonate/bicarbonate transport system substrate-binding protein